MTKSDFFFLLVLASIPIQLGKFFWPNFAFVLGIPIDYRAIIIYLIDFIILGYLFFFLIEIFLSKKISLRNFKKIYKEYKYFLTVVLLLNLYLVFNALFVSQSPGISYWLTLRFFILSLFGLFASMTFSKVNLYKSIPLVIGFSIIWQSILIFLQFVFQKSLGLWFLGERSFDSSTIGIAHAQIFGRQLLRPYGTFPHPNVAAAYLLISLIIFKAIMVSHQRFSKPKILTTLISLAAILLTYSKAAYFATIFFALFLLKRAKTFILGIFLLTFLVWIFLRLLPESQFASIAERLVLLQAAINITLLNPLFGVGSGDFIAALAKFNLFSIGEIRLLQPVHNVFFLILAENGLLGLFLFLFLLLVILKKADSPVKIALFVVILVFATFDHFLWTLQQGRLLFWIAAAYILSNPKIPVIKD